MYVVQWDVMQFDALYFLSCTKYRSGVAKSFKINESILWCRCHSLADPHNAETLWTKVHAFRHKTAGILVLHIMARSQWHPKWYQTFSINTYYPSPPKHRLVCGRDTSSKEDGSFRSLQSATTSILGPYSSKTDCAVFIEIPWPKSCQHHRVLATTKSTDCLAAWHEKSCRKKPNTLVAKPMLLQ